MNLLARVVAALSATCSIGINDVSAMPQAGGGVERILTRRSSLSNLLRSRLVPWLLLLLSIPSGVQAACTTPKHSYAIVATHVTVEQICQNAQEAQALCNTFIATFNGVGGQCFGGSVSNGLARISAGHFRYNGTGPFYWLNVTYPVNPPLNDVPDIDSNLGSPSCSDGCFGDPVNAGTGNKFEHQTDYAGQGSLPLTIRWTYNSRDGSKYLPDAAFIFGRKRTYAYSESVKLIPFPGKPWAYVTRADGKSIGFQGIGADWIPKAGEKTRLYAQYSGTTVTSWLFEDEEGEKYLFNASGRLLEVSNAMGGRNTLTYNAQGRIDKVVDQSGRALKYEYNASGLVSKILLPGGGDLQYFYSSEKDLIRTQFPGGVSRQYLYNEAGLVVSGTSPGALTGVIDESSSRYSSTSYDAKTKALTTKLADGLDLYTASYQMKTHQLYVGQASVTFPTGKVRNTSFTAINGRALPSSVITTCTGCPSQSTTYTYDENGYEDLVTKNGVSADYDYDSRGQLTKRVDASSDDAGNKRAVQIDWHPNFNAPAERRSYDAADVLVGKQVWVYNARGQALTVSQIDPVTSATRTAATTYCEQADVDAGTCPLLGLVTSIDGPRTDVNDVTTYTYYPSDDATCSSAPATCPHRKGDLWMVQDAVGNITETLKYDGAGRVLSVKDANGVVTDFEYHPRDWLTARKVRGDDDGSEADDQVTRIDYYPTGLVQKTTLPDGSYTSYTYDAAHRLTDITDGEGNKIHYTLDNAGNRTKEDTLDTASAVLRTLSRVYNQLGELQTHKDAYNHATGFDYDANGNTDTVTDALSRVTDNDYDPLNRLSKTIQDVGGLNVTTQFQYDAQDNLTAVVDPKGLTTGYTYNGLGDLTQLSSPDTGVTSYTHDSAGNRKTQTDARNVTASYGYDALNRLTSVSYPDSSLNVGYSYDTVATVCTTGETFAAGRLSQITDASGSTQYCYDRFGNRVRKVQTTNGQALTVLYAYTKAGQVSSVTYPDGSVADYVRDALGRATEVGVTRPGGTREILLTEATYYPFGSAAEWVFGNGRLIQRSLNQNYQPGFIEDLSPGGLTLGYEFDAVGNLATLRTGTQLDPPLRRYGYDALNRLTESREGVSNALLEGYGYDATGNRTSASDAGGTTSYTLASASHRLTEVGGIARSYDNAGNTSAIGTRGFVYDDTNRMSQVTHSGVTAMSYAYNGKGEQVRRYNGTTSTVTVYDEAGHWLGEYDNAGVPSQQVVWLDDLPVGLIIGTTAANQPLHYIEADALGTPRTVIESQRNVALWEWPLVGEAFGNDSPTEDADGDGAALVFNMRFPGQRYDAASGLNYNYFRNYEITTGRYVESDPIGLEGGISTYLYVGGSPLDYVDPFGLKCGSGQESVWTFDGGVPRSQCRSSANPSGNLPYSNPTGDMAFFHPNTNTPKGNCQGKCLMDLIGVNEEILLDKAADKAVDKGLGKLFWGATLTTMRALTKGATMLYDLAAYFDCLKPCKTLDGCQ